MQDLATIEATSAQEVRRLEVLSGPGRRRSYTVAQKARMVAEMLQPGVSAADVVRWHGVHLQQLYTWRRKVRRGELPLAAEDVPMFAALVATVPSSGGADTEMVVELDDLWLWIGVGVPPERAAALIAALRVGAPARLIESSLPTEAMVAQVLVGKYADHLPLYRQVQIYERQSLHLDRSTLADWVGHAARELRLLHARLAVGARPRRPAVGWHRPARQELLGHLAFEGDAMGSMLCHGFHLLKARHTSQFDSANLPGPRGLHQLLGNLCRH